MSEGTNLKLLAEVTGKKNWVYDLIFWGTFLCLLILIEGTEDGIWSTFSTELLNISFYAVLVYTNIYYLIPKFLAKNKFLQYFIALGIFILMITPLKMMALYLKFSGDEFMQTNLLKQQSLIFLSNFFVGGISTIYSIINDWAKQVREKQELENQTMVSELKFLRSQINPHFLFNTLNNLYALTLKKSDQAPEIVLKLSEMMRYMLYECNESKVLISKEINYIRNYLDLERIRHRKKVKINFELEGTVQHQKIAPLLLITFIENCFKHGIKNSITTGFVNLKIRLEGDDLYFTVENSKPSGLPNMEHKRAGGIGLVNVRRRLELLYPKVHDLIIEDSPNSYKVELHINTL